MAMRAGVVRKQTRDPWQVYRPDRPPSAYVTPFAFTDFGVDGREGTADDQVRTFLGVPQLQTDQYPVTQVVQNVPAIGRYTSLDVQFERRERGRWSAHVSAAWTWAREHAHWTLSGNRVTGETDTFPAYYPNSPNDTSLHGYTNWIVKAWGTYLAPWRLRVVPVLRHQSGQPYGRSLVVTAPAASGAVFQGTVLVEPLGTRRMDNLTILDVRVSRAVQFGRLSLDAMADVFNTLNSHAVHGLGFATGPNFERPLAVVSPRTLRLAARMTW